MTRLEKINIETPHTKKNLYSVVIPAYNEEDRIQNVLEGIVPEFKDHEIIVIFDGTDSTPDIVGKMASLNPNLRLIQFSERLGKGKAIIEGFKASHGDKIGFIDADESVEAGEVRQLFDALQEEDGVIASRRLKESKILVKQPFSRRMMSNLFNLIFARVLFGLPYADTQCGAKVFKREAIYDVLNDLKGKGFEIDLEILWKLKKRGYNVIEYPITWKHSNGSKFKLIYSFEMFDRLMKIRFG